MATKPTITGTMTGQQSTNESSVTPFSQASITDTNPGANDTLTIVLEGPGGTLSGNGLTPTGTKTYTLSGTAAQVTAELQALTFTPVTGKPGSQTTTRFRLTDRSSAAPNMPVEDSTTSVVDSDTPAAPGAPRLTAATDTGVSHTDNITDDTNPSATGEARPGATVTIYAGNTVVGQGAANADTGAYTIAISGLAQGANAISATQTAHGLTSARGALRTVTLDTTAPAITAITDTVPGIGTNGSGTIGANRKVTFTLTTSEPTYVTGGKPTLMLNDGGVATYVGGSGKNQLQFSYTVSAGQNTNSLKVTGFATNGATVTDKAGNALSGAGLNSATMPTGNLIVDTTAPIVHLTSTGGITSKSSVTLTGTVSRSDSKTKISVFDNGGTTTVGTVKVNADGSFKLPIKLITGTNVLSVISTDGAGNASQPVSVTYVDSPTMISINPSVSYNGGAFTISGKVSDASGVKGVEVYDRVGGQRQDLGPATVNADGTFTFTDVVGAQQQGFITATETDGAGGTASARASYSLMGGKSGAYSAEQDRYNADGSVLTATDRYKTSGAQDATLSAGGQTFTSAFFDTFNNDGQPSSTFVFDPGFGRDVVNLFRVDGADHDILSFKGSDFGTSPSAQLAAVLANSQDTNAGLLITDPTPSSPGGGPGTYDTLLLKGITKQQLSANQGDVSFHA